MEREDFIKFITKLNKLKLNESEKLEILKYFERELSTLNLFRRKMMTYVFMNLYNSKERDLFIDAIKTLPESKLQLLEKVIIVRNDTKKNIYNQVELMIETIKVIEEKDCNFDSMLNLFCSSKIVEGPIDNFKKVINFVRKYSINNVSEIKNLLNSFYLDLNTLYSVIDKVEEFSDNYSKASLVMHLYKLESVNVHKKIDEFIEVIKETPDDRIELLNFVFERFFRFVNKQEDFTLLLNTIKDKNITLDKLTTIVNVACEYHVIENGNVKVLIDKMTKLESKNTSYIVKVYMNQRFNKEADRKLILDTMNSIEESRLASMFKIVDNLYLIDKTDLLLMAIDAIKSIELSKLESMERVVTNPSLLKASCNAPEKFKLAIETIKKANLESLYDLEDLFSSSDCCYITVKEMEEKIDSIIHNIIPPFLNILDMTKQELSKYQSSLRKSKKYKG